MHLIILSFNCTRPIAKGAQRPELAQKIMNWFLLGLVLKMNIAQIASVV